MMKVLKSLYNFIVCPQKINRLDFLMRILFWLGAVSFITIEGIAVGKNLFGSVPEWVSGIGGLLMITGSFFACLARLRDINEARWHIIFIILFPQIGIIYLLCRAGTQDSYSLIPSVDSVENLKNSNIVIS